MHIKSTGSLAGAMRTAKSFNQKGIACSLTHLPTGKRSPRDVKDEVKEYQTMLEAIAGAGSDCDITTKLSPLGVHLDERLALESMRHVIDAARQHEIFVWLDMELPETVDATLRIYRRLQKQYSNFGICLQAYLERTAADAASLLHDHVPMRLVKGFYRKHDVASWREVTANYREIMRFVLLQSRYPAIATHDLDLISTAKQIIREFRLERAEFQFFWGLRDELARELVRDGFRVRIFIPFGNVWRFLVHGLTSFDLWHQAQRFLGLKPQF
jgi:proline dehydrogenase